MEQSKQETALNKLKVTSNLSLIVLNVYLNGLTACFKIDGFFYCFFENSIKWV